MYSVMLMMALSSGGDMAPTGLFHRGHGCSDCSGCSGYVACSGGYGCYGGGCHSSCHGGHRLFGHRGHGCCGGESCSSSCHGGHRLFGHHRGHGCCSSSCHGGYVACNGGYGGCYGGGYPGCTGGYPGCGGAMMAPPVMMAPPGGAKPEGAKEPIKAPTPTKKEEALVPTPATIIVSLPAQAKLTFDGVATKSTSATRVFATPALENGKEYYYTLSGELTLNGKTLTASKRVVVRSGEETRVSLEFPVDSVAQR